MKNAGCSALIALLLLAGCSGGFYATEKVSIPAKVHMASLPSHSELDEDSLLREMVTNNIIMHIPRSTTIRFSTVEITSHDDSTVLFRSLPAYITGGVVTGHIQTKDVHAHEGALLYWSHDGQVIVQVNYLGEIDDLMRFEIND